MWKYGGELVLFHNSFSPSGEQPDISFWVRTTNCQVVYTLQLLKIYFGELWPSSWLYEEFHFQFSIVNFIFHHFCTTLCHLIVILSIAIFHKYCCYVKHRSIVTNLIYEFLGGGGGGGQFLICLNTNGGIWNMDKNIYYVLCSQTYGNFVGLFWSPADSWQVTRSTPLAYYKSMNLTKPWTYVKGHTSYYICIKFESFSIKNGLRNATRSSSLIRSLWAYSMRQSNWCHKQHTFSLWVISIPEMK